MTIFSFRDEACKTFIVYVGAHLAVTSLYIRCMPAGRFTRCMAFTATLKEDCACCVVHVIEVACCHMHKCALP